MFIYQSVTSLKLKKRIIALSAVYIIIQKKINMYSFQCQTKTNGLHSSITKENASNLCLNGNKFQFVQKLRSTIINKSQ